VADIYVFVVAAMALAYDSRRVTRDVDALFKPHGIVLEEARAIAAELGLPAATTRAGPGSHQLIDSLGSRIMTNSAVTPDAELRPKIMQILDER
jgi:hypothetical protein